MIAARTALSRGFLKEAWTWLCGCDAKAGLLALFLTLVALGVLAGVNVSQRPPRTAVGEIASADVVSPVNLVVKDDHATHAKQEEVAASLPAIFDLNSAGGSAFRKRIGEIFARLDRARTPEEREDLAERLSDEFQMSVTPGLIEVWSSREFQNAVRDRLLPLIERNLREGVVADSRVFFEHRAGIEVRDRATGSEQFRSDYRSIADMRLLEEEITQAVKADLDLSPAFRRSLLPLLQPLLFPTLEFNRNATAARAEEAVRAVAPVEYVVEKGETIVRKGDRITRESQIKINAMRSRLGKRFSGISAFGATLMGLLLSLGLFFSPSGRKGTPMRSKDLYFISLLLAIFALGAKGLAVHAGTVDPDALFHHQWLVYAYPLSGAAGLSALVFSARRYVVTGLLLAFFCALFLDGGLGAFLFYFLGAMWMTWLVRRAQNRYDMLMIVFPLTFGQLFAWLAAVGLEAPNWQPFWDSLPCVAVNGVFSIFLLFAISPILEAVFHFTTRFRLMELMNLEQPLLQEMMVKTPGTYHHSLLVSNLVEAAANAINCNAMLGKVAALYHDIGKLAKPEYFIENLFGRENKHDRLAPSMSALILQSHVKRGVELAEQYRLGVEITDIIRQHHGTNTIQYFYRKAQEAGENPRPEDYAYPGPRPQSREAALVMLADAVEASSRTLTDPTPSRIQTHVSTIVKNIFATGQLDESQLTFQDINRLCDSFQRVLTGIFHHRIEYPDQKKAGEGGQQKDDGSFPAAQPAGEKS